MKRILSVEELITTLTTYFSYPQVRAQLLERFDEFEWLAPEREGLVALSWNGEISILESEQYKQEVLKEVVDYSLKKGFGKLQKRALEEEKELYIQFGFEEVHQEEEYSVLEYLVANAWLGQLVHVEVDQVYGQIHPYLENQQLPINIGYVYDAEKMESPVDAYVVGIKEALSYFDGVVVAVIYHEGSEEAHLVVSRIGEQIQKESILKDLAFQEQYFSSRIVWYSK